MAGTVGPGRGRPGPAGVGSIPVGSLAPELRALLDPSAGPSRRWLPGPLARTSGATAMMDISDGLVRDGGRLAAASGVVLDLDPAALKLLAAAAAAGRRTSWTRTRWRGCWAAERTTACSPHSPPAFSCLPDSLR